MKLKTKIKFGGITLAKVNHANDRVPLDYLKIDYKSSVKKALAIAYKENIPCLLIGETGTGKTSAIKELAYLLGQEYTRISLSGYTSPDELIGSKSVKNGATYFENGVLSRAMTEGHIVVLDELNAISPDCSFIIHGLLDDEKKITLPNGDVITPHKNFRLYATQNPDYEGTKSLNRAFFDRFGVILLIDILEPQKEIDLLIKRYALDKTMAKKLVTIAGLNRKAYSEQKTLTLVSTRGLLQVSKLIKEGLTPLQAYTTAIVNKARGEERTAFLDFYNMTFRTNAKYEGYTATILTPSEVKAHEDLIKGLRENISIGEKYQKTLQEDNRKLLDKISELEKVIPVSKRAKCSNKPEELKIGDSVMVIIDTNNLLHEVGKVQAIERGLKSIPITDIYTLLTIEFEHQVANGHTGLDKTGALGFCWNLYTKDIKKL